MRPLVPLERGGHAEGDSHEKKNDEDRDEISHWTLCYQTVSTLDPSFSRAYATCFDVARRHYENFPVASWLLPSEIRPHVAAVYAFARYADDFADEGDRAPSERLTLLDDWLRRFHVAVNGEVNPDSDQSVDLVFAAVNHTMTRYDLPASLFEDLISAFRQDVTVDRYESWETLLDYCRRSANPVGRLVLRIAGRREEALERASDCLCSALQIANFLQDFDFDWQRGRLYIPSEVSRNFSASESELDDDQLSPAWRATIADVARRNRQLFDLGRSICDEVGGRLGLELRFTWLGGCRILDQLKSGDYDPRMRRPKLGAGDFLPILWKAANWQRLS